MNCWHYTHKANCSTISHLVQPQYVQRCYVLESRFGAPEKLLSYDRKLMAHYSITHPKQVFPGSTEAFDFFKENYSTHFTPEEGNAGTFYLHPNKKGAEVLGNYWGEAILKAIGNE